MMFADDYSCLSEHSKILVKGKHSSFYSFMSLSKLIKALEDKKELRSLDENVEPNKIIRVENVGLQDFIEVVTFGGAKILLGKDTDVFVDGVWIKVFEMEYYEKIHVYDVLKKHFHETSILSIKHTKRLPAYKIYAERDTGIVVNNLIVRFIQTSPSP